MANVIERMFHVECEKERDEWCTAIALVADKISLEDQDVDMRDPSKLPDKVKRNIHISTRNSVSKGFKIVSLKDLIESNPF